MLAIAGVVIVLFVKVCVFDAVVIFAHSIATTPADTLVSVVSLACHSSILHTHNAVLVDETSQDIGNHEQFVRVPDDGVHNAPPLVRYDQAV